MKGWGWGWGGVGVLIIFDAIITYFISTLILGNTGFS